MTKYLSKNNMAKVFVFIGILVMFLTIGCVPNHYKQGVNYFEEQNLYKAEVEFKKAIEKTQNVGEAYYHLGVIYMKQGRLDPAFRSFEKVLEIEPTFSTSLLVDAYIKLGEAYVKDSRVAKTDEIKIEQLESAINAYKKALNMKENQADVYIEIAETCRECGDTYTNLYNKHKESKWKNKAKTAYTKSIEHYEKALEIKPSLADVSYAVGCLYYEHAKYEEAIKSFERTLEIDSTWGSKVRPKLATAHNTLGVQFGKQGKVDLKIEEYKKAIEINPNYALAYRNLGSTYELDKKDFNRAIRFYKKAIEIEPDNEKTYCWLGDVYRKKGALKSAISEYEEAIRIAANKDNLKTYIYAHFYLAYCLYKRNNVKLAKEHLMKALKLEPGLSSEKVSKDFTKFIKEVEQEMYEECSDDDKRRLLEIKDNLKFWCNSITDYRTGEEVLLVGYKIESVAPGKRKFAYSLKPWQTEEVHVLACGLITEPTIHVVKGVGWQEIPTRISVLKRLLNTDTAISFIADAGKKYSIWVEGKGPFIIVVFSVKGFY